MTEIKLFNLNISRKEIFFSTDGVWTVHIILRQKISLNINLTSHIKTNIKWITDVSVKCKAIKLKEENMEKKMFVTWG